MYGYITENHINMWAVVANNNALFNKTMQFNETVESDTVFWTLMLNDYPDMAYHSSLLKSEWDIAIFLDYHPDYLVNFDVAKFTDTGAICTLISHFPEIYTKFDLKVLDHEEISTILCAQPQLFEHFDTSTLTGIDWSNLLFSHMQFLDKCPLHLLSIDDIKYIATEHNTFLQTLDFEKLDPKVAKKLIKQE